MTKKWRFVVKYGNSIYFCPCEMVAYPTFAPAHT